MNPKPETLRSLILAEAFFPATCHPDLSRRRFLVGVGALVGATVAGPTPSDAASDDGTRVIQKYATVPEDPWAVAHGIRAMGRDFRVRDGRLAVNHLLENVSISLPANGTNVLAFAPDVEVHPNAFLAEALLEPGVPLDRAFTHHGSRRTLEDLVKGARALFRPQRVSSEPNALPWSLIAFTRTTSPVRGRWTNAWGEPVDLDVLVETALQMHERASLPLLEDMRASRPEAAKAPVHSFTCGGTHMLYALLTAVHAGYRGTDRLERVRRQVDLMVWRLGADVNLMERFYKERTAPRGASWYLLDSKLKLLGHAEECLAFAERRGLVTLTAGQQAHRRVAVNWVRDMLDDLGRRGLEEARAQNKELFHQLVGDACHARHGLTLT